MTHKLRRLERIIDRMADALDLQDLCALADEEADLPLPRTPFHHQALQGEPHPHDSADREHLWEVTVDPHCEPASIPASCISEVRSPGSAGPPAAATPTLVSKGVLSQEEARYCLACTAIASIIFSTVSSAITRTSRPWWPARRC